MTLVGVPFALGVELPDGSRGWHVSVIWITSGAQVYTWVEKGFVAIEIFTCKPFETHQALACIERYFRPYECHVSTGETWRSWLIEGPVDEEDEHHAQKEEIPEGHH